MQACCNLVGGGFEPPATCTMTDDNGVEWGLVPGGVLWMGCNAANADYCWPKEVPQHPVKISKSFWLQTTAATTTAYAACGAAGAGTEPVMNEATGCRVSLKLTNWGNGGPKPRVASARHRRAWRGVRR